MCAVARDEWQQGGSRDRFEEQGVRWGEVDLWRGRGMQGPIKTMVAYGPAAVQQRVTEAPQG